MYATVRQNNARQEEVRQYSHTPPLTDANMSRLTFDEPWHKIYYNIDNTRFYRFRETK